MEKSTAEKKSRSGGGGESSSEKSFTKTNSWSASYS